MKRRYKKATTEGFIFRRSWWKMQLYCSWYRYPVKCCECDSSQPAGGWYLAWETVASHSEGVGELDPLPSEQYPILGTWHRAPRDITWRYENKRQ